MLTPQQIEELNDSIFSMDRATLIDQLKNFPARFPIDFTSDFYKSESIDKLRHILFGLCMQNRKTLQAA